jgi:hypothetical protein
MRYKVLGRSGVRISEVALATMTFGEDWDRGRMSCGKPPLSPGFTAPNYPTSTTPARRPCAAPPPAPSGLGFDLVQRFASAFYLVMMSRRWPSR